jgi:DNA-binding winged helix-turn-helix (wHTH) protein
MQPKVINLTTEKRAFANCILDPMYQTISTPDKIIRLRGKLFAVLCCLVDNQNRLVTREQLIKECWCGNNYTGQRAATHTIFHLRKMLKQQKIEASITTLSKQGYLFTSLETHLMEDCPSPFASMSLQSML